LDTGLDAGPRRQEGTQAGGKTKRLHRQEEKRHISRKRRKTYRKKGKL
jgi:hypothetical protein